MSLLATPCYVPALPQWAVTWWIMSAPGMAFTATIWPMTARLCDVMFFLEISL
jgi:hypothetical protein